MSGDVARFPFCCYDDTIAFYNHPIQGCNFFGYTTSRSLHGSFGLTIANRIQIVGMSATLPNIESFQKWFKASVYVTSYRPVPLKEHFVVNGDIYTNEGKVLRYNSTEVSLITSITAWTMTMTMTTTTTMVRRQLQLL